MYRGPLSTYARTRTRTQHCDLLGSNIEDHSTESYERDTFGHRTSEAACICKRVHQELFRSRTSKVFLGTTGVPCVQPLLQTGPDATAVVSDAETEAPDASQEQLPESQEQLPVNSSWSSYLKVRLPVEQFAILTLGPAT